MLIHSRKFRKAREDFMEARRRAREAYIAYVVGTKVRTPEEVYRWRTLSRFRQWKNLLFSPTKVSLPIAGGFLRALKQRLKPLWQVDSYRLKGYFSDSFFYQFGESYFRYLGRWILLLPPLSFCFLCLLRFFRRLPVYFCVFFESFFENFLFYRFKEKSLPRLSFFYRSVYQPMKRFFRWVLLFFRLDWNRVLFWSILYETFVKHPIQQRIYKRGWRFLRSWEILELEIKYAGGWPAVFRRIFRPVIRPISRLIRRYYRWKRIFFFSIRFARYVLFTRIGRAALKLELRRRHLMWRHRMRFRRLEYYLWWKGRLLRIKIFAIDVFYALEVALRVFRAQPLDCLILGFLYLLIGICFLLEFGFRLLFYGFGFSNDLFPSRMWKYFSRQRRLKAK